MRPNVVDVVGSVYSDQEVVLCIDGYRIYRNAGLLYPKLKQVCPDANVDGINGVDHNVVRIEVSYYSLSEDDVLELAGSHDNYCDDRWVR